MVWLLLWYDSLALKCLWTLSFTLCLSLQCRPTWPISLSSLRTPLFLFTFQWFHSSSVQSESSFETIFIRRGPHTQDRLLTTFFYLMTTPMPHSPGLDFKSSNTFMRINRFLSFIQTCCYHMKRLKEHWSTASIQEWKEKMKKKKPSSFC